MEAIEITSNQKMDKTRNKNTIWTIYYNAAKNENLIFDEPKWKISFLKKRFWFLTRVSMEKLVGGWLFLTDFFFDENEMAVTKEKNHLGNFKSMKIPIIVRFRKHHFLNVS